MDKEDSNNTLFSEKLTAPPEISGVPSRREILNFKE